MNRLTFVSVLLTILCACSRGTPVATAEGLASPMLSPNHQPDAEGTPAPEWRGIPILPEATSVQESGNTFQFAARTSPADVEKFYTGRLTALGWNRPFEDSFDADGGTMTFRREGAALAITVTSEQDSVVVVLVLTQA